jgi:drug/metabolite transporter (DMT)-like permease
MSEHKPIYDSRTYLLFLFLTLVWGAAYFFMHEVVKVYPPFTSAMIRIVLAALSLVPLSIRHFSSASNRDWIWLSLSGILGNGLPALLYMMAMKSIDSNIAGILNATTPIWILVVGYVIYRNKNDWRKNLGILIGFLGICVLFLFKGDSEYTFSYSLFLILGATLCYGLNVNLVTHQLKHLHPMIIGSLSLLFIGVIYTFCLLFGIGGPSVLSLEWHGIEVTYLFILGVLGTAASNIAFYLLVQRSTPNFAGMVTFMMPFVSIVIGYIMGETIFWQSLVCFILILFGVYLVKRS